ncbi:MAG: acetyl-CoA C-acyltransferase [Tenacibaculum sp.]
MDTYIFDAVRTPIGRGHKEKGALKDIRPVDLILQLTEALEQRNNISDNIVDELILGATSQVLEQGGNLAKIAMSYLGWDNVPGTSINSYCSSGMSALFIGAGKVGSGLSDILLVGGVEMLSRVPMYSDKSPLYFDKSYLENTRFTQMGVSADLIATIKGYSRKELDQYAVLSHKRAANAIQKGYFNNMLIPVKNNNAEVVLDCDENVKPNTSLEILKKFEPIFKKAVTPFITKEISKLYLKEKSLQHHHHIGNSPNMSDGACLILVGNKESGKKLGLKPRAKIKTITIQAVEPLQMLNGGQLAALKAFEKTGLTSKDMDYHYYAEAFSSSCLKYLEELNVDIDIFNPNGGTMSMGHAQGASGASLTGLLLEELERTDKEIGVASISGLAMGTSVIVERV